MRGGRGGYGSRCTSCLGCEEERMGESSKSTEERGAGRATTALGLVVSFFAMMGGERREEGVYRHKGRGGRDVEERQEFVTIPTNAQDHPTSREEDHILFVSLRTRLDSSHKEDKD